MVYNEDVFSDIKVQAVCHTSRMKKNYFRRCAIKMENKKNLKITHDIKIMTSTYTKK